MRLWKVTVLWRLWPFGFSVMVDRLPSELEEYEEEEAPASLVHISDTKIDGSDHEDAAEEDECDRRVMGFRPNRRA